MNKKIFFGSVFVFGIVIIHKAINQLNLSGSQNQKLIKNRKMNDQLKLILAFLILVLFSSCAIHNGLTSNQNGHNTEVQLSRNNFKVVQYVEGSSRATYVFGIGGLSKPALISRARQKMLEGANLIGTSKAVVNETVEIKHSFFPLIGTCRVNLSAYVIEFTE
jgi:hypothetical protein